MVWMVLSEKEMDRLCVLRQVKDRQLTQEEAGHRLELTSRQIRRLLKKVEQGGSQGIKSRKVGGNRTFSAEFKVEVMEVVKPMTEHRWSRGGQVNLYNIRLRLNLLNNPKLWIRKK